MAKCLFSTSLEGRCAWCINGHPANDSTKILCNRKGIVDSSFFCRKYKYDPLKRVPISPPTLPQFDSSDFSL
jgi:hypothetical protein